MKKMFSEIYNGILASFKPGSEGFMARKLSAFIVIVMIVITHIKWFKSDHWELLPDVLFIDSSLVLALLGLVSWQSIAEKKLGKKDETGS